MSENFPIAYLNQTERSSVAVTLEHVGVEAGGIPTPPDPHNSEGWVSFGRNGRSTTNPDVRFEDNIHDPTQRPGS